MQRPRTLASRGFVRMSPPKPATLAEIRAAAAEAAAAVAIVGASLASTILPFTLASDGATNPTIGGTAAPTIGPFTLASTATRSR